MLKDLAPFASLIESFLWVLFALGVLVWLRDPVKKILSSVHARIESGSNVKAGPFELTDQLRPLTTTEQQVRAKAEAEEQGASTPTPGLPPDQPPASRQSLGAYYLQSEDLALRAIQTEFDVPITRQVGTRHGDEFDAAFVKDGVLHVVEVKTIVRSLSVDQLRASLHRIATGARRIGGPKARVILVAVMPNADDTQSSRTRIQEAVSGLPAPVEVRVFSMKELTSLFIAPEHDG